MNFIHVAPNLWAVVNKVMNLLILQSVGNFWNTCATICWKSSVADLHTRQVCFI
jgi:hypothetical protein